MPPHALAKNLELEFVEDEALSIDELGSIVEVQYDFVKSRIDAMTEELIAQVSDEMADQGMIHMDSIGRYIELYQRISLALWVLSKSLTDGLAKVQVDDQRLIMGYEEKVDAYNWISLKTTEVIARLRDLIVDENALGLIIMPGRYIDEE